MTTSFRGCAIVCLLLSWLTSTGALVVQPPPSTAATVRGDRRQALSFFVGGAALWTGGSMSTAATAAVEIRLPLTDTQLQEVVTADILQRQFLVTGQLTPSVYDTSATFTDEIDTYSLADWQKGTARLFVAERSAVRLVGDVKVTAQQVEFRFDEDLTFRIPPFYPKVALTGKVLLTRDEGTGYITSYREFWDQDVASVLRTATFF